MSKYGTSELKELVVEACNRNLDILYAKYKTPITKEVVGELLAVEKTWKRTKKSNINPRGTAASTSAHFNMGAIERVFDFENSGIMLKAFVYTNLADEQVVDIRFIVFPSREIIQVSVK